jgi:hypothetical protein
MRGGGGKPEEEEDGMDVLSLRGDDGEPYPRPPPEEDMISDLLLPASITYLTEKLTETCVMPPEELSMVVS